MTKVVAITSAIAAALLLAGVTFVALSNHQPDGSTTASTATQLQSTSSHQDSLQIVIIGAGISGLTTAYELLKKGHHADKIKIIEQRDYVGGRVKNVEFKAYPGKFYEGGGTWIGASQYRVTALLDELTNGGFDDAVFQTFYNFKTGEDTYGPAGNFYDNATQCELYPNTRPVEGRPVCSQLYPDLNPARKRLIRDLDELAQHMSLAEPWKPTQELRDILAEFRLTPEDLDGMTVREYISEAYPGDSADLTDYAQSNMVGSYQGDINQMSMLYFLFLSKSCPTIEDMGWTGGGQDLRMHKGTQDIAQLLRSSVEKRGVAIEFGVTVDLITNKGDTVEIMTTQNQQVVTHTADRVVIAMSTPDSGFIEYDFGVGRVEGIDAEQVRKRRQLMTYSNQPNQQATFKLTANMKVAISFDYAFWRPEAVKQGLSTQAYHIPVAGQAPDGSTGALWLDYSPDNGIPGVLMAFWLDVNVAAYQIPQNSQQAQLFGHDRASRARAALTSLCSGDFRTNDQQYPANISCDDTNIDDRYAEQSWKPEMGTVTTGSSWMFTNKLIQYGSAWRSPIGRIHWGGSDTAQVWMGYMDGAVESGQRTAAEVRGEQWRCSGPLCDK